jgi:hypothetical protein
MMNVSSLKMEALRSSYKTTLRHNREDHNHQIIRLIFMGGGAEITSPHVWDQETTWVSNFVLNGSWDSVYFVTAVIYGFRGTRTQKTFIFISILRIIIRIIQRNLWYTPVPSIDTGLDSVTWRWQSAVSRSVVYVKYTQTMDTAIVIRAFCTNRTQNEFDAFHAMHDITCLRSEFILFVRSVK